MATGNTLVHRSTGSGATSNPNKSDFDDKEDQEATNNGYEDDGGDSKSARLTLMEEILLLGLKDREVRRVMKAKGLVLRLRKNLRTLL